MSRESIAMKLIISIALQRLLLAFIHRSLSRQRVLVKCSLVQLISFNSPAEIKLIARDCEISLGSKRSFAGGQHIYTHTHTQIIVQCRVHAVSSNHSISFGIYPQLSLAISAYLTYQIVISILLYYYLQQRINFSMLIFFLSRFVLVCS